MRKRADDVADTRQRIVDAAVRLHGTIGPAATTISALAEEAGVTRVTVYRHFPDDDGLYAACSAHWAASQVLPDPEAWRRVADPARRVHTGLSDLYRFYREGEPMLTKVRRDRTALPTELRQQIHRTDVRYRDVLLEPFPSAGARLIRVRACLGHAVSFWTWRSLCIDQGLSNRDAVRVMTELVVTTAGPTRTNSRHQGEPG
nr:transcriptional regulator, TetR family [Kibdelosporangium sp. MJ126-NF4]CTQ98845.1 transcriptional regulator, TetR family [Kibdelosporangium sp. MJ126-NF4]